VVIKNSLYKYFFLVTHFCYGQLFYTENNYFDSLENDNNNEFSLELNQFQIWNKYLKAKKINYLKSHHFGIFLNYYNESNSNIIQEKSDLIGNGLLTNYHFNYKRLEISNSIFFTDDYIEAKRGFVRTIKNVTMYTNQAYFKYSNSLDSLSFSFKLGRDFLIEGYGNTAKLFFSNYSRPFDQITLTANYRNIYNKISAIRLDDLDNYERNLYMHSISYKSEKLDFTVGEAIISSGLSESINIKYLNPFNFWSWENIGSTTNGLNAFLFSGMSFKVKPSLNLYFEILIDDVNFHQKNAFYLNRYAYLLGVKFISFPFKSSLLLIENSNVLNQVYQSYDPSHVFTHMGYPIGHHLGNDFINYRMHYSQILKSKINKIFFDYSYLIKGQNSLETPFENPWENNNGEFNVNYKHPGFPTPPLTYFCEFNFGLEIKLKDYTYLILSLENNNYTEEKLLSKIRIRFWTYMNIKNE